MDELEYFLFTPLRVNAQKWSNTLTTLQRKPANCLNVFDHFAGLGLKGSSFMGSVCSEFDYILLFLFLAVIVCAFLWTCLLELFESTQIACRRFESVFYRRPPLYGHPPHPLPFISFRTPFLTFFRQYRPMKCGINTKINSRGNVNSSCQEDYKTMLHIFW